MDVLKDLNFQPSDFPPSKNNIVEYDSNLGLLHFIKMKSGENFDNVFYDVHRDIWNENKSEIFIAIVDDNEILICDSKTRPEQENPIENVKIKSFKYGENTKKAERYKELLKKENIDNGFFWEDLWGLIKERKKKKKRSPIDKDLLDNLNKRREELQKIIAGDAGDVSQKLIDRCLFIRFIEDRIGFSKLKRALEEQNVEQLLGLFEYYNGTLNGDLFEEDDIPSTINAAALKELNRVFGEYYIYSSGQRTIIPYKFDKISILLISNIYQKFLEKDKKDSDGIVFTPENIVNFMNSAIFGSDEVVNKARKGEIKVLDSACGSGIFLVKTFEKLIAEREGHLNMPLGIHGRGKLLKKCIYGIDLDPNALRVAAFSLYLKIFEGEDPKTLKEEIFDRYDKGLEHFMFPGLKGENLIEANSLFEDVLNDKFDIILGNPPWGYEFNNTEKQKIDKEWGEDVSQYQSSQCFVHKTKKWMKEDTIAGMVVNISNFTNARAKKFRAKLLRNYSILNFVTLTRIGEITFEESDEPACILIFTLKKQESEIEFLIPDLTQFSKLTKMITIKRDDKFRFSQEKLKDDTYWHISLLGLNRYLDLIKKIGQSNSSLDKYSKIKEGAHLYATETHKDIASAKRKYESKEKLGPDYYPLVRSIKTVRPFLFKLDDIRYIKHGPHLHRHKDIELFQGDKLIITRSWPLKSAFVEDTIVFDNNFDVLKLNGGVLKNYLYVFEAILNSKLGYFYLDSLYRQRPEGNFSKVNKGSLEKFPVPNLENKGDIVEKIINAIKEIRSGKDVEGNQLLMDDIVFNLYELDYYEKMQILDYCTLQRRRKKNLVTEEDFGQYIEEFQDSFSPMVKEGYVLNAECYSSDFLGSLVRFSFSKHKKMPQCNLSRSLKKLLGIIQMGKLVEIDYKSMLEEERLKIYNKDGLIIYKSNQLRDWTRTEAMNDVREEVGEIYRNLPN